MLLLAITFWAGGGRADRLLRKVMPKGVVAVGVVLIVIFAVVCIADPVPRIIGVVGLVAWIVWIVVTSIILLIQKKAQARRNRNE